MTMRGRRLGGIVHTYQRYDPKRFPSPTAPPPDLASAAFEHMLAFGSTEGLTPEQLAEAVELDVSQIAGLGPSLDALIQMLLERKRKILSTYETDTVQNEASRAYHEHAAQINPPDRHARAFVEGVRDAQIRELERLWYAVDNERHSRRGRDDRFAAELLRLIETLGEMYEVDELAANYTFTGRTPMDVPRAIEIKEELEAIDRLLEQLREARQNAKVGIINLEELARFAQQSDVENLERMRQQIEDFLRSQAEAQGLEESPEGYRLTPHAMRLFQGSLLSRIFEDLQAARSGRHTGPISGEGAVEIPATKGYEFGDSPAQMDVPQSFINALLREGAERGASSGESPRVRLKPEDIEIHRTRNTPKCATAVLMDMSGSMRYGGQYVNCKRMAIALDGLIRREFPGDHLQLIEVATFARPVPIADAPKLMPKPVTIYDPVVRLRADMSRDDIVESMIPPHFTNIQHGLRLARRFLSTRDTPNRQIVLITDGLPTAHFEDEQLFMLYPPDPRTEEQTMREARLCARDGITINFFVLPNWWQSSEDIQFAHRVAETTRGRVFFTGGTDLDRFVLWDYVGMRRSIIG